MGLTPLNAYERETVATKTEDLTHGVQRGARFELPKAAISFRTRFYKRGPVSADRYAEMMLRLHGDY